MKNIGMIVAVEIGSVTKRYGEPLKSGLCGGFPVMTYSVNGDLLHVLHTGAGQLAAAAGTQALISELGCGLIVNFGVVGGLTPEMTIAKTCIVEKVVHYDFDGGSYSGLPRGHYLGEPSAFVSPSPELLQKALSICPELTPVVCASADKFVEGEENKSALHEEFGAHICEMEAAAIVYTCRRNKVPSMLIKAVSDGITGGFEEFAREVDRVSDLCLELTERIMAEL